MPIKDPEKRRLANAERMRRRRAEGTAWIDPEKEAARKRRWYDEGGKEKIVAANRARRQRANEQAVADFSRRITHGISSAAEGIPSLGTGSAESGEGASKPRKKISKPSR